MRPGEYFLRSEPILINQGRKTRTVTVINRGDRPLFVGSHYHFYETNPDLFFDRDLAKGMRLNIGAGEIVQFPPGEKKRVELVEIGGRKYVYGFRGYVNGPVKEIASSSFSKKLIARSQYAKKYGPTAGDKIRLADTDIIIEVEKDLIVYGDELRYGWLKNIRDGMGMAPHATRESALDLVITNVLILDYWGIIKADIGIKDGKIYGIGHAGNPDYMDGIHPNLIVGPSTEVIAGENMIITAGGIDSHIHQVDPQLVKAALEAGITTMLGGGTGPTAGSIGTNISPGSWYIHRMMEAAEDFPMNFGFWGRGNASFPEPLEEQIAAGAAGLKIHEDWGATPAVIDNCLTVADKYDIQICIHTDSSNESGTVETTSLKAIKGRVIHSYHTEGAGGGHSPDIIQVARESYILPSSTNPTRPFTINTAESNLQMMFQVHHVSRDDPAAIAMAEARIRPQTMAAEGILQDMGAISVMSSDSEAMGHVSETIIRTWQTAHVMKHYRGRLEEETGDNDNFRAKRYVAKYTINPAIIQGISEVVGSIEVGKLADLVLWRPEFFGIKPELVMKGGFIATAPTGMANGGVASVEPVRYRPMWAAFGKAPKSISYTFTSKAAVERGVPQKLGLEKQIYAVRNTRNISKKNMILNDALPEITVDPETFHVYVNGEPLDNPPAATLPMSQKYFLF
ncbi:urease subunit alpha [Bacillus sp. FJAT-27231]|uniref:urease subunit alpha n=1 Tax=Bacillus sp. FJAT-27231 TaxID=1679168 RepID=UPI000671076D|nr:urease subunit alpha [Bacillus sp. FJAT-27231]KMY54103.1 urease subunit alpha [Bacillus sp. FJAT-27231]